MHEIWYYQVVQDLRKMDMDPIISILCVKCGIGWRWDPSEDGSPPPYFQDEFPIYDLSGSCDKQLADACSHQFSSLPGRRAITDYALINGLYFDRVVTESVECSKCKIRGAMLQIGERRVMEMFVGKIREVVLPYPSCSRMIMEKVLGA